VVNVDADPVPVAFEDLQLSIESDAPVVISAVEPLGNHQVRLTLSGSPGQIYSIETAPDLGSWTPLATITNQTGTVDFLDESASGAARRFYRARRVFE
jgi:hypothetical protein